MRKDSWMGWVALLAVAGGPMAHGEWYQDMGVTGDMRYRFEQNQIEGSPTQERDRIRARLGFFPRVNEDVDVGLQLATDDFFNGAGEPRSNNQTLTGENSKKSIFLDLAYLDWHPHQAPGLDLIGGKMKNPLLLVNDQLWDSDVTPEGLALKYRLGRNSIEVLFNGAYEWLNERAMDDDSKLFAGQMALNYKPETGTHFLFGGTYQCFTHMQGYGVLDWRNANNPWGNSTATQISGTTTNLLYATDFRVVEGFVEAGTRLGVPLSAFAAYDLNTAADANNKGWTAGLKAGQAAEPNTFEFGYDYRYLEKDVFPGFLTDLDSWGGGTDGCGHRLTLVYQLLKNLQVRLACFLDKKTLADETSYKRFQVDFVAKF